MIDLKVNRFCGRSNKTVFNYTFSFCAILFFIFFPGSSFSQNVISNYIGGSFGGSDFHIKDLRASPLIFSSIGIAPSVEFIHRGEKSIHYFEASYFYDYLKTSVENFSTINHRGRIRYCYVHSITDFSLFNRKFDIYLGGSIATFLSHSDYFYSWISQGNARAMESWYWSNSLDLSVQSEVNISAREFVSLKLFIPVVSNISRPDYSPSADYNYIDNDWKFKMFGKTGLFPNNFSLNTVLTYQRPLIWNFNLQVIYEFYYSTYNKPKDVNMYMNNLRTGIFFCF